MSKETAKWTTPEREYIIYENKFVKRSLAAHEYKDSIQNPQSHAYRNNIRLKNEAECLRFMKENTKIPVPGVLAAYERDDGSFVLETELVNGVEMMELNREQREIVKPQIRQCAKELHSLRSNKLGGPSGIIWPPYGVATTSNGLTSWSQHINFKPERPFVFCHRDLSQSNVLIDPTTLNLTAVIDWECGGYYPEGHELPFFESSTKSGVQVKTITGMEGIKRFWENSSLLKIMEARVSTSSPLGSDSDPSHCRN